MEILFVNNLYNLISSHVVSLKSKKIQKKRLMIYINDEFIKSKINEENSQNRNKSINKKIYQDKFSNNNIFDANTYDNNQIKNINLLNKKLLFNFI